MLTSFWIGAGLSAALFSIPGIVAGWALLARRSWSRKFALVVSALHLISIPVGTFVGIYGIWALASVSTRHRIEARVGPLFRF